MNNNPPSPAAYAKNCRAVAADWLEIHDRFQYTDPALARFCLIRAADNHAEAQRHETLKPEISNLQLS